MTDRDHHPDPAHGRALERERDRWRTDDRPGGGRATQVSNGPAGFEETAYGRPETGVGDRAEGMGSSGGYGDQGGFGSQHGQGGYASPAQGSRYGQTGSDWGRSGYGEEDGRGRDRHADDRTADRGADRGRRDEYGFRGPGGGGSPWGGARGYGEGGYGAAAGDANRSGRPNPGPDAPARGGGVQGGGTYGQQDDDGAARRSQARLDQGGGASPFGDPRGLPGASGRDPGREADHDHDHDPSYRRWRDEQLSNHDRDYDRWRASQAQRYDDDYRRFRDERHSHFSTTFEGWRTKGAGDAARPQPPGAAPIAATSSNAATGPAAAAGTALAGDPHLRSVTDGGDGHADTGKSDHADAKPDDKTRPAT